MDAQTHWEKIYTEKAPDAVSWYRPHLETSLALIEQAAAGCSASVIEEGGSNMTAQTGKNLTRRSIVKSVAFAAAGASLLTGADLAEASNKDQPVCCGDQPFPDQSVFTTVCNDKSAEKYRRGDNPVVYRLGALWLMLTTENWMDYFRDPKNQKTEGLWLDGLAKELKLDLADVKTLWEISKTKADSFKDIRASWKNFTSNTGKYGARPCHGGKTILNIACLDKGDGS